MSSRHRTASLTSGPRSGDDVREPRRPALKVSARRASGSAIGQASRSAFGERVDVSVGIFLFLFLLFLKFLPAFAMSEIKNVTPQASPHEH